MLPFLVQKNKDGINRPLNISELVLCVGHQGYVSCSFDCCCQRSLVFCTVACDSSRQDFASFRNISSQFADIFVINCCYFVSTALANAFFSTTTFSNHDSKSSLLDSN